MKTAETPFGNLVLRRAIQALFRTAMKKGPKTTVYLVGGNEITGNLSSVVESDRCIVVDGCSVNVDTVATFKEDSELII